jgi:soluble cytochrome b562
VENVERDPTKSFFNLFWKGIEQGLKKTLIGVNIDKTEKTVKDAVSSVKEVKQTVKELKQDIKAKKEEPKPQKKEKKGFLKGVFKKKEKPVTE